MTAVDKLELQTNSATKKS